MGRDRALDAVRGLCICYMAMAHVCYGSALFGAMSFIPWVDGASGFILISGLVLGMLSRRRTDVAGVADAQARLGRRTALLYASHLALTALTVVVAAAADSEDPTWPSVTDASPTQVAGWLVTMQINPRFVDVLSMYVVLLVLAIAWTPLLERGWWPAVAGSSALLYAVAVATGWGRFPNQPDGYAYFNTAAWQALFASAFVVGWHWNRLADRMRGPTALAVAVGGGLLLAATGVLVRDTAAGAIAFDKPECGVGRIVLAWAVFVVLHQLSRFAVTRTPALVGPMVMIGSRSLACFIALCVIETFLPLAIGSDRTTFAAQIAGVLTVLAMYPIARARGTAGAALTGWRRRPSPA
nr:OpgC domain-containing protein [Mycolicibacterium sp. P1-18]